MTSVYYKWSKIIASKLHGKIEAVFDAVELQELLDDIRVVEEQNKEFTGWIPVSEGLPEFEQDVLLYDKFYEGVFRVGHLSELTTFKTRNGISHSYEWGTEFAFDITHWMPLPAPPCRPCDTD